MWLLERFAAPQIVNCDPATKLANNCQTNLPQIGASPDTLKTALQIVFGVLASVTVLIIVIAGMRFILAQGDPQSTAKARQSIIYAAVGLGIALFAEMAVTLLIGKI